MRANVYCHIGMQKAGSKAIQHACAHNAAALSELGIVYPRDLERGVWHRKFFQDFDETFAAEFRRLAGEHETLVLSYETAYMVEDSVIETLAAHAASLNVYFLVREPVSWVNSWINQIAKAHRSTYRQFRDFSVDAAALADSLDIAGHLARWEKVAGRERITVAEYDGKRDVVPAFMDWLAVPAHVREAFEATPGDPNKALNEAGIRVFLNVKRRAGQLNRNALAQVMKRAHSRLGDVPLPPEGAGTPFRLVDDEMAAQIVTRYQPAFDAVMARYAPGVPTDFAAAREAVLSRRVMSDFTPRPEERALAQRIMRG